MGKKNLFAKTIVVVILSLVLNMGMILQAGADALTTKGSLSVGSNVSVTVNNTSMVYYKVVPTKTDAFKFTLSSKTGGSTTAMKIGLYDSSAKELTVKTGDGNSILRAYLEKGKVYYVGVALNGKTASENCSLSMEESEEELISIKVASVTNAKDKNFISILTTPVNGLSWNADENILTMNGFSGSYVLKASIDKDVYSTVDIVDLTINVKGVNTLNALDDGILIGSGINVKFAGDGILNIVGNNTDSAIEVNETISIEGANINISGTFTDDYIDCSVFMMSSGSIGVTVEPNIRGKKKDFSEYRSIIDASKSIIISGGTILANYQPVKSGTTLADVGEIFDCSGYIQVANANIVITGDATVIEKVNIYYGRATTNVDKSTVNEIKGTKVSIKYATLCLSQYFYTYDGKAKKPAATIAGLKSGTDFTVTYKNNVKVGTATVTATGKGNYSGTLTKTFVITAKKGSVITDKKYKYKVTKVMGNDGSNGNVMVTGLKKTSLTQIKIAAKVTINGATYDVVSIKKKAFKNNKKIKKVTIGLNVKNIGNYAFAGCKKVKKLVINSTVLSKIGVGAFKNNKKLKTAVIKSTKLKTIGKQAFFGDKKLKTLKMYSTSLKYVKAKAFYRKGGKKLTVKVPSAKVAAYKKLFKKAKTNKYVVKAL